VVSHDRHLLGLIADRLVLVADGTARELDGSLDDYRDQVLSAGTAKGGNGRDSGKQKVSRKDARRSAAEARERTKDLRKAVVQAEVEMKQLWRRRDEIDAQLAVPNASGEAASELMKQRGEIERNLAAAEARWLEASEIAEQALGETDA
jgi:ATP-binding cassette subfamily F protein 3